MWMHDSEMGQAPPVSRYPGLGARLREAISAAGYNPHSLAKAFGVAYTTVDDWLREISTPRTHNLERLAELLGRPVEWFLHGDEPASSPRVKLKYPSLAGFLEKHTVEPDEIENLESIFVGFGDPGEEYWWQALGSYRLAKRFKSAESSANLPKVELAPAKKRKP
jgi:transcriptional regulator with XRE-family HTH domain